MNDVFSLEKLFAIAKKNIGLIIGFTMLSTAVAVVVSFFAPKTYKSTATVVAANPLQYDKTYAFQNSTLELTSVYGVEEDMDRLVATAKLDGNLNDCVAKFKLDEHYKISGKMAKAKAMAELKNLVNIFKDENGVVKIQALDKDAEMAANIANHIVSKTNDRLIAINQSANKTFAQQLQLQLQALDSLQSKEQDVLKKAKLQSQAVELEGLFNKFNLDGLRVLEPAYASSKAAFPKVTFWAVSGFVLGFLFIYLWCLLVETRKEKSK
jgi:capsular polysaccharide biosynthesis protein